MLKKVEDNTNLKRAEEALRESDVRYRQLFQSAPIALIEWDVSPSESPSGSVARRRRH